MTIFVDLNLPVEPRDAIAAIFARYAARQPGAVLREGHPLAAAFEAIGFGDAENANFGQRINAAAFDGFGRELLKVDRILGSPTTATSTWTARDTAGYTFAAGTVVLLYEVSSTDLVVFRPSADVVIPEGQLTVTDVPLIADQIGEQRNGLAAKSLQLGTTDARIASVATTSTTVGGVDPESDTNWLNRLAGETALLNRHPHKAAGFAAAARRQSEVHRARGFRLYNGATDTPDDPGHISLVTITVDGQPVSAATKTALQADLGGDEHIANFVLHLLDPTYQAVTVDAIITPRAGADPVDVQRDAEDLLDALLLPGGFAGGNEQPPRWDDVDLISHNDLVGALYDIPGLRRVEQLLLDGAEDDVTLVGLAVLPDPTITVTIP